MSIEEAIKLVGIDEVEEGFGGDFYFYKIKGYYFSISLDSDFDLNRKIGQLSFNGNTGKLFGYAIGLAYDDLEDELFRHGYELNEELGYGENTFKKNSVIINISEWENKILKIRIILEERKYDGRVY